MSCSCAVPISRTSSPLLIVQTFVCQPRRIDRPDYRYEVQLAPDQEPKARRLIVRTNDLAIYQRALEAEGGLQRFIVQWHVDAGLQVLDAIAEVP